jgi:hypothetical protein
MMTKETPGEGGEKEKKKKKREERNKGSGGPSCLETRLVFGGVLR